MRVPYRRLDIHPRSRDLTRSHQGPRTRPLRARGRDVSPRRRRPTCARRPLRHRPVARARVRCTLRARAAAAGVRGEPARRQGRNAARGGARAAAPRDAVWCATRAAGRRARLLADAAEGPSKRRAPRRGGVWCVNVEPTIASLSSSTRRRTCSSYFAVHFRREFLVRPLSLF